MALAATFPLSRSLGLRHWKILWSRKARERRTLGRKVEHCLQATRWGRGYCVTEVRPGGGLSQGSHSLWVPSGGLRRALVPRKVRCLEPGVSSAALSFCRFPSCLLHDPEAGSRTPARPRLPSRVSVGRRTPRPFLGLGLGRARGGLGGPAVDAQSPAELFPVARGMRRWLIPFGWWMCATWRDFYLLNPGTGFEYCHRSSLSASGRSYWLKLHVQVHLRRG